MKNSQRFAITGAAAVVLLLLGPVPGEGQLPRDPVERARVLAQVMEFNARQLTLFDREGKVVSLIGPRDLYNQPVLSPDARDVAVIKSDVEKETNDLWVFDVATGQDVRITTTTQAREGVSAPTWSPDGTQIAYVALRNGAQELTRRSSDGDGPEEVLYRHTGSPITLTDWSLDGRFLIFSSNDLSGGILYALPIAGDRTPVAFLKSEHQIRTPRLSPDNRFVAFPSNESGRVEVYVRSFDPSVSALDSKEGKWQVSDQGTLGMVFWRRDGKELFFLGPDRSIMSVDVDSGGSTPRFGKPRALFRASDVATIAPGTASVSRSGDRIVVAVPPPQLRQITVLDRAGKVVSTVGPPGFIGGPGLSPDGKRVVVVRNDPQTGNADIWTYDIESGKGTAITNDIPPDNSPIWSADGKQIVFATFRKNYGEVYRKASDGTGPEELLFRYTEGAGIGLNDWSADGRFLTFSTGALLVVPLRPDQPALERKALDWLREDYNAIQGRFSPDGRFLAYMSDELDFERMQVYVRPFDSSKPEAPAGPAVQISQNGSIGGVSWRQDGKELYFMTRDWEVMALDIATTPTFKAGTPRLLFKLPGPVPGNPGQKFISSDGQRFVFVMPAK